jgi:hypothetical protein
VRSLVQNTLLTLAQSASSSASSRFVLSNLLASYALCALYVSSAQCQLRKRASGTLSTPRASAMAVVHDDDADAIADSVSLRQWCADHETAYVCVCAIVRLLIALCSGRSVDVIELRARPAVVHVKSVVCGHAATFDVEFDLLDYSTVDDLVVACRARLLAARERLVAQQTAPTTATTTSTSTTLSRSTSASSGVAALTAPSSTSPLPPVTLTPTASASTLTVDAINSCQIFARLGERVMLRCVISLSHMQVRAVDTPSAIRRRH